MKRVEINTLSRTIIIAADSIKHIEIKKDTSNGTKCLFLNINESPFFVTRGEENIKNATDELKDVFEELEKFVFEPTNFSKMIINISEEKKMIKPAFAIVELQCEQGGEPHRLLNKHNIKQTISHLINRYEVKVEDIDNHCQADIIANAKEILANQFVTTLNFDYAKIVELNGGVFETSYIRDDFE